MPIVRTYACPNCNLMIEVTLTAEQWDEAPPVCPTCQRHEMQQEFKPVALGGSTRVKAIDMAQTIASEDYHVADIEREQRAGGTPKVRYQDQTSRAAPSTWTVTQEALSAAMVSGRASRMQHGSGLDVLQANLKSGAEPDLIANSKKRMIKVW